jgi:hypothetical protein
MMMIYMHIRLQLAKGSASPVIANILIYDLIKTSVSECSKHITHSLYGDIFCLEG